MSNPWDPEMCPISLAQMCNLTIFQLPARAVQAPIPHVQRLMDAEAVKWLACLSYSIRVDRWWLCD